MATIPTDSMFGQQWHLRQTVAGLYDLNVVDVWDEYRGAGVDVFVIDDGFDYTHSDLAPNYALGRDYDYSDSDADPFGTSTDSHGTAVAGLIGAARNGSGAVGIAFDATVVGYRTYGLIADRFLGNIRDAIAQGATNGADVINMSLGIANAASTVFGAGLSATLFAEIEASIASATGSGRGGLGTVIVKSAGNSRGTNYDVNLDPWGQDTRQIVVAAVNQDGTVSSYSSYGAANLVSAFGTPGEVITTDRVGAAGYTTNDFTTFNGTSAAAPMVSGVVSLMLDANEGLGWRDVQSILAYSSRQVGSAVGAAPAGSERFSWNWNGADNWNGGGLHFSNDYGYGLVDAFAAVRLAETWTTMQGQAVGTTASQVSTVEDGLSTTVTIPDATSAGTNFTITETQAIDIERVTLTVSFATTYIGDVLIQLTSPDGTMSELVRAAMSGQTERGNNFNGTWTFESQAFRGESSAGAWTVRIADQLAVDTLTVSDLVLTTYGSVASVNDNYIYTDEFSRFAGVGGHGTTLNDTNGGTDWLNAAAVRGAMVVNLTGAANSSAIDGVSMTITNVENAIGGDGGDFLYGSSVQNILYGMRGNDTLGGNDGDDFLMGGTGEDRLYGDNGVDGLYGGLDNDRIYGGADRDYLFGEAGNDFLAGESGIDALFGGIGNDYLYGGTEGDYLYGEGGIDALYGETGDDRLIGGTDNDYLYGQDGLDFLYGEGGSDALFGGAERDVLYGQDDGDYLYGEAGNDQIEAGAGADSITGGTGNDTLYGEAGGDYFYMLGIFGTDQIADFSRAAGDRLVFSAAEVNPQGGIGLQYYAGSNTTVFSVASLGQVYVAGQLDFSDVVMA